MKRLWYIAGWGFVALSATLLFRAHHANLHAGNEPAVAFPGGVAGGNGDLWFASVRSPCNALEAELLFASKPPPSGS